MNQTRKRKAFNIKWKVITQSYIDAQHRLSNIEDFNNFPFNVVFVSFAERRKKEDEQKVKWNWREKIGEKSVESEFISNKENDRSFDHQSIFWGN